MKSNKTIIRTLFINTNAIIVMVILSLAYFMISKDLKTFRVQCDEYETELIKAKKSMIKNDINLVISNVNHRKKYIEGSAQVETESAQKEILDWIKNIRLRANQYVVVNTFDGVILSHYKEKNIGKNMWGFTDKNGMKPVQEAIEVSKNKDGGYISYVGSVRPSTGKPGRKITYAKSIPDWEWTVLTGVYLDDIDLFVDKKQNELKENLKRSITNILFVLCFTMLVSILIIKYTANKIKSNFTVLNSFFSNAANNSIKIDPKELFYSEFATLANAVNKMTSERKQTDDKLRKSEERFRSLFENSEISIWNEDLSEVYNELENLRSDGITDLRQYLENNIQAAWEMAAKVKVLHVNKSTLKLFSTSTEDKFLNNIEKAFGSNAIDIFVDELCAIWNKQKKFHSDQVTFRTYAGKDFSAIISFQIPETAEGFKSIPVSIIDISERKRIEDKLRESESRFRSIFEGARDGVLIANIHNKQFVNANPTMCAMTGYKMDELLTLGVADLHPQSDLPYVEEQFEKQCKGELIVAENIPVLRKDGTIFPADISVSLMEINDCRCSAGFFRDVTDRNKVEKQLQQAQKMEAIGTLAGGIAHDFNNILSAILGYSEMALEQVQEGSTLHDDLNQVLLAGNRAKELVSQILAFSRQSKSEQIRLQPQSVISEAIKLLRPSLPTTITIKQEIADECGIIKADPTQLHQVIMNLCTNAYQAMEKHGGRLFIGLKKTELTTDDLQAEPSLTPGSYIQLTVGDTGPGIDPASLEQIFDPYFTTKEVGKGTGMGLAVVHGIVQNHWGMIRVHSKMGEGTTFHVFFPELTEMVKENEVTDQPILPGNERILYIDDEQLLADLGKQVLERLGYSVTASTNSLEALEIFKEQPDQFDLVITDQTMPGMTGDALAREIFNIRSDMPVILCTGYSSIISREKALAMGISAFVMKPMVKKDIAPLIRRILDGEKTG